ncbi:hypothetical protein RC1_1005 [Rhodospirillum centenum SW]|uniref:Transmembrane protein n=2 Tax=Rhodospirillum centenum TaxID=34018 RepID=B6ISJ3_RHOCS|nr:hypothetical protein RC1_1005 [Rhodospirillum centenum SW]
MSEMPSLIEPLFGGAPNLSFGERALYVVGGLGLAAAATKPRPNPLLNVLALAGGAYLTLGGYYGRCPVRSALSGDPDGRPSLGHQRGTDRDSGDGGARSYREYGRSPAMAED